MVTEPILVPSKDLWKRVLLKSNIRMGLERRFRESKHLEIHFVRDKCYVTISEPIAEFSKSGQLHFRLKEKNLEFQIVPEMIA